MRDGFIWGGAVIAALAAPFAGGAPLFADAASLAQVRQNGSLRLCANPSALPYSNHADRGGLAGFDVELAEAVAHELGLELTVTWVQSARDVKKADCDASMGAIALATSYDDEGLTGPLTTRLPLRFSKPYAAGGVYLAVSSRSSVRRLEDLKGQKIGVTVGTIEHEWLAKRGFNVSVFAVQEDIIAAIETGEISAGATNPVIVGWYRHEHPNAAVKIPEGYEPEPALRWNVSIGLRGADDALVQSMDAAIERVIEQRKPDQIYAKYGITYYPPYPTLAESPR